jgi:protein-S-isoprenylcysteine O-methyltransferase Ste14
MKQLVILSGKGGTGKTSLAGRGRWRFRHASVGKRFHHSCRHRQQHLQGFFNVGIWCVLFDRWFNVSGKLEVARIGREKLNNERNLVKPSSLLPTHYLLIAILSMIALHCFSPLVKVISTPWTLLGLLPLVSGVVINLIADNAFHKANTTVKPFQQSTSLITDGVFRYSRNPMYLGFLLVLIGIAILFGSLSPWFVVPIFAFQMDKVFVRVEERMLEEKFGPSWVAYKEKVRRWI